MDRDQVLTPLRNLIAEKPNTKMGQIRWAWPEIRAALAAGHTLQECRTDDCEYANQPR